MSKEGQRIELSLVAHTNIGKTTLARTLLGREVGEVRDAPHVTGSADPHTMIETAVGDEIRLWDTPGFGDSARLVKRLRQSGNPVGWFLSQVWDRWRDRPFWSSQQAVRNIREVADVVLYLVSSAEDPAHAGYVTPELQILEWIGKPVVVLLNQIGPPRAPEEEEAEQARWCEHVMRHAFVRAVLTLDAFARFWVQEFALLAVVGDALPEDKRGAFARLQAAWHERRLAQFDDSMKVLADGLARAAFDREPLDEQGIRGRLRDLGTALAIGSDSGSTSKGRAMKSLAERLDENLHAVTDRLISIHGLEGKAAHVVLERVAQNYTTTTPMSEGKAALAGGLVSGAISGLTADLAAGGLTFGAGMLTGSLLGALGGVGLAKGFNLMRGEKEAAVTWSDDFLVGLAQPYVLTYLAVAHYGRGRGQWRESELPDFWRPEVASVLEARRERLHAMFAERTDAGDQTQLATTLGAELETVTREIVERLYPGSQRAFRTDS